MPIGATVLDFAFSIHSFLGSHCFGAKVNHRLVPLSYRLKSGDQVEILTSRTQHVQPEWLGLVTTAKARGKVQALLRHENREKMKAGEAMLQEFLKRNNFDFNTSAIEKLRQFHGAATRDELMLFIGNGTTQLGDDDVDALNGRRRNRGWRRYVPFIGKKKIETTVAPDENFVKQLNRKQTLLLNEDVLAKCRIASCCHPIPGDDVLGYISPRGTLDIHKRNCPTATKLKARYGNNIIAAKWDTHRVLGFEAAIYIKGVDSRGSLYAIADVLHNKSQINLHHISVSSNDGIFEGILHFLTHDTEEVKQLCETLMKIKNVEKAYRVDCNENLNEK